MPHEFDPAKRGDMASIHLPRWEMETDFSEMTLDVLRDGKYLPRFSAKENEDDYKFRRLMSAAVDMLRDAIQMRVDNIWRTTPDRSFAESKHRAIIEDLVADADGDGTPLDSFMKRALWNYYVTGVDIVTQMAAAPEDEEVVSRADEERLGLAPFFQQFTPIERVDWAVNGARNFIWSRYALGKVPQLTEIEHTDTVVTLFLTVTQGGFIVWQTTADNGQKADPAKTIILREAPHPLGRPPITKLYFAESQKTGQGAVPLSLLTRPAPVAYKLLNLSSQADIELLANVPRWFATGFKEGELPGSYGPAILIRAENTDSTLQVVQGDSDQLREKRDWITLYIDEMLRLLKFTGGVGNLDTNSGSGIKIRLERTELDNELRSTAEQLERTEQEMIRQAVSLATGKVVEPKNADDEIGFDVQYNRDFVLEPVREMLENLERLVKMIAIAEGVPEMAKEMTRQIANKLVRDGTEVHGKIMDEIDAAKFDLLEMGSPDEPVVPDEDEAVTT